MNTDTNHTDDICVVIHEPELVTVSITTDQLELLRDMCDLIRDDDDDTNPCIAFADALHTEITAELDGQTA